MPLFAVERDLSEVSPDRFRSDLRGLVKACERLQSLGKKVRYISSAVFPVEARGLCLFGAEEPQWIREVNEAARLPYLRIFAVLDLTPVGVRRELSCGRRPPQAIVTPLPVREPHGGRGLHNGGALNGGPGVSPPSRVTDELARWTDEGRELLHVLGGWLEEAGRIRAQADVVEAERDRLADEVCRYRAENTDLRAEREELQQTLQALASRMTQAANEILSQLGPRGAPGDLAER